MIFTAQDLRRKFFLYYGTILAKAGKELMEKQGRFIRDRGALHAEMLKQGVDIEALRDPWGQQYETRFLISGRYYLTQLVSHGEELAGKKKGNGTIVWEDRVDYFETSRRHIDRVLAAYVDATGKYPINELQLKTVLRKAGLDLDKLPDPWGSPYYVILNDAAQYGDRVRIQQSAVSGQRVSEPVTLIKKNFGVMSAGEDKQPGTSDDFLVANYSILVSEQSVADNQAVPPPAKTSLAGATGAIIGTVEDPSGAVIVNASAEVKREQTSEHFSAHTDSNGKFELKDLQPGFTVYCARPLDSIPGGGCRAGAGRDGH